MVIPTNFIPILSRRPKTRGIRRGISETWCLKVGNPSYQQNFLSSPLLPESCQNPAKQCILAALALAIHGAKRILPDSASISYWLMDWITTTPFTGIHLDGARKTARQCQESNVMEWISSVIQSILRHRQDAPMPGTATIDLRLYYLSQIMRDRNLIYEWLNPFWNSFADSSQIWYKIDPSTTSLQSRHFPGL